jgi:hypothetical protein
MIRHVRRAPVLAAGICERDRDDGAAARDHLDRAVEVREAAPRRAAAGTDPPVNRPLRTRRRPRD